MFKVKRKSKPQQKIYKPGSGPLKRSSYGLDGKMDTCEIDSCKGKNSNRCGSQTSVNGEEVKSRQKSVSNPRHKKPEQQLYMPRSGDGDRPPRVSSRCDNSSQHVNKRMLNNQENNTVLPKTTPGIDKSVDYKKEDISASDLNSNRQNRHVSESRSISPMHCSQDQNFVDRHRDSRSMETWAGRNRTSASGKPPSGRRNSAGYSTDLPRPKHINLDNIPPRFRKKFIEQSSHNHEGGNQLSRDKNTSTQSVYNPNQFYNTNSNWSQTLPSRGRGRLRDNEDFDREKFISSYLKNYDVQNSRRSTPSSSYMNLYEPNVIDNRNINAKSDELICKTDIQNDFYDSVSKNGVNTLSNEQDKHEETDVSHDDQNKSESGSINSTNLADMTNLDWTEEVEKNIKLDDVGDTITSFSQSHKASVLEEISVPRESKRSGRSQRRDKRSSSRGQKNSEKKERNRKDSNVSIQSKPERNRRESNVSNQHDLISANVKHKERERRDSHRSNRSSTIGNSRDDLDKWRSLRSYSREQSSERRIVSQCNSRETSSNRALSPRDTDGFRVPKAITSAPVNQKNNGSWPYVSGRTSSIERRRQSPAPSNVSINSKEPVSESSANPGGGGGGRRSRKRASRRRGRNAENIQPATHHPPGSTPAPTNINWREEILESKKNQTLNDRRHDNTHQRSRLNSVLSDKSMTDSSGAQPGLIILPQSSMSTMQKDGRYGSVDTQKTLFDHQNPSKPIIVQTSPSKVDLRLEHGVKESTSRGGMGYEASDAARAARHVALLQKVDRADAILRTHTLRGPLALASHWDDVIETRKFLQDALQKLLMSDLKYCQSDNIEHQFWKILYYNFIEILRRSLTQVAPEVKPDIIKLLNTIIEEGNVYFENLVQTLEKTYKFNTDDYLKDNHVLPPKGLGYVGLALISVQKLYVFLGDLARYKEQVNETNNYAKSKFWYTKAQQINPKNGRPYNQLALLAIYARRKLDAVYYYMRSLMSSNPFQSARESLLSLFDENRKKYETAEKKRRAMEAQKSVESSDASSASTSGHGQRHEVWLRPGASLRPRADDERFDNMTSVELNKNFITSYLHVHGKLITKIGMETLHESAARMLRQFRALLHRQPLPTPAARLLQLTALNMFAVETNAAPYRENQDSGERSAWLECALGVSLLMFGALLERCCALLPEPSHTQQHADALLLLPAIKVWSDWMLCHSSVWNPPPSFDNFEIGSDNDPWDWLANLMNILEKLDDKSIELANEMKEDYVIVRLAEDASLAGFTPLMYMEPAVAWVHENRTTHHAAEHALRTRKLLFFGTEYLVGVEPPVLKLEYPPDASPRYVSAVQRAQQQYSPLQNLPEDTDDEDSTFEATSGPTSLSEGLEELSEGADEATKRLLKRKEQLESRKAILERRRQRMQEMVGSGCSGVEVTVRPRLLVPDTNCFIDHLPLLQAIAAAPGQPYTLAVPLVVVTELEGLRKCARVGTAAQNARTWLSGAGGVRLATARGSLLASRAFTAERDHPRASNDDRVLATALNLHSNLDVDPSAATASTQEESGESSKCLPRVREVVLLTDDRNLRVKALAADLPTRDLPSFVQWAGLKSDDIATTNVQSKAGNSTTSGHN
ncbi:telomerase-binding protein EST1A isoform X1 [Battus philenor]|uniref:telomerase-binding protein EST1A isoform X1 n=1 Tax=Battus philenor TaxID=42288 RepID=UPI0035CEE40D